MHFPRNVSGPEAKEERRKGWQSRERLYQKGGGGRGGKIGPASNSPQPPNPTNHFTGEEDPLS